MHGGIGKRQGDERSLVAHTDIDGASNLHRSRRAGQGIGEVTDLLRAGRAIADAFPLCATPAVKRCPTRCGAGRCNGSPPQPQRLPHAADGGVGHVFHAGCYYVDISVHVGWRYGLAAFHAEIHRADLIEKQNGCATGRQPRLAGDHVAFQRVGGSCQRAGTLVRVPGEPEGCTDPYGV
jgi:hypothetical protein